MGFSYFFFPAPTGSRLPSRRRCPPEKGPGKNTKPPAVPHAAGGLLLVWIFQWTVTSFPLTALGFRLKCPLSVSSNPLDPSGIPVLHDTSIRGVSFGPDAYSSLFGTMKDFISLRVPNRQKLGFLSSFPLWKTVPLSTWDSPFLSVCIVLYFPIIVNAFLSNFYEFIWCSSPKIRPAPGAEAPVPAPAGEVRLGAPPPNRRDAPLGCGTGKYGGTRPEAVVGTTHTVNVCRRK